MGSDPAQMLPNMLGPLCLRVKITSSMSVPRSIYSWRIGSTVLHDERRVPNANKSTLQLSKVTVDTHALELATRTVVGDSVLPRSRKFQKSGSKNKLPGVVSEAEFLDRKGRETRRS
jgi:hypothetical protein